MDCDIAPEKIPATINELQARVAAAFGRHPLCREVRFDVVSTPKNPQRRQLDRQHERDSA
jgi:hypothetical protein